PGRYARRCPWALERGDQQGFGARRRPAAPDVDRHDSIARKPGSVREAVSGRDRALEGCGGEGQYTAAGLKRDRAAMSEAETAEGEASSAILFVGAGQIGLPILLRLLAGGLDVHVADSSPGVLAGLAQRGVRTHEAGTITRLMYRRAILCLPDPGASASLI